MKKIFFTCLLLYQFVYAQTVHHFSSSEYIGTGAYSKKFTDVFSFAANPAALSQINLLSAGLFSERKFLLKELSLYNMAIVIPSSYGAVGIFTRYNGFTEYNETQFGLAYAKSLGQIDMGLQFNYSAIRLTGYGNTDVIHADAGMIWHLSEKLHTGILIKNAVSGKFSGNRVEKPAWVYKLGLGYEVSDMVFISSEICKEENKPATVVTVLQCNLADKFMLKAGITTAVPSLWIGAGWSWKNFRVDITSRFHPQLGFTPGLLFIYSAKHKKT